MYESPSHLRFEHLTAPLGTTESQPRLSWRLPEGASAQHGYELEVGGWSSGRRLSPAHLLVPYDGPRIPARTRVDWRVRVRTDLGESPWSASSWWETGMIGPADWTASWVAPAEDELAPPGARRVHVVGNSFLLPRAPRVARAYATAHGLYELFLNGRRVGDQELTPGFTAYRKNLQVQTFDVTGYLNAGRNHVTARLADGWFRGQLGYTRDFDCFGQQLAFLAEIHADGQVLAHTDETWLSRPTSITADLIEGQFVDFRDDNGDGSEPAGACWRPVRPALHDYGRLRSSAAPDVRRIEALTPTAVTRIGPARHVVDLGQNINGWVRLRQLGEAGTRITLTHGERLGPSGDVDLEHLRPVIPGRGRVFRALGQVDEVVSAGRDGDVFEPRLTTHGFRYVRVDGLAGDLAAEDVDGIVVHSDLRRTGWFSCSDDRLNRLHEAAVWSLRGNMCDIPTDCPQRERSGWTGDWQLYLPTAAFLFDVAGFTAKWLRDLRADQWPDGRVPNVVPNGHGSDGAHDTSQAYLTGSAGWGDASVIVPWHMWRIYEDVRLLEESFPSMVAWVGWAAAQARNARHPRRTGPAEPHERYLWDTGFQFGEWTEPGEDRVAVFMKRNDASAAATAYLHRSAALLSQIADRLGHAAEADRCRQIADGALDAWRREFIGDDGRLLPDTQANHARALAFGLVPEALRDQTAGRLAALVRDAGNHVGTGFLATPLLLAVLADSGHLDVAYDLLLQDEAPSWLYMLAQGATTIWENWAPVRDGDPGQVGEPMSLNHYSKGAVISFLHEHVAGIRRLPDSPGYRRFRVRPRPGGGLTRARAEHDSPYGRIVSAWEIRDGRLLLDVTVPPGTTAQVQLPDGSVHDQFPGSRGYECPWDR
ncbi:family 78 glycoside hydrolase catalytic domain [Dactylosporangium sucinum]|uniref:alpha-L-rhamnosidase n=1 Tax=Dactylosporangium sucinum TaxID=1424081 RepID=A0A917X7F1_9ACTN|nr:family 78 glycoside hydrolase catalytic domain [Dactylosporangium sucinum]GGM82760.1 alpha-L-rhamnosidase [Dactylosporangium sucinum]